MLPPKFLEVQEALKFCFTSALGQASKMVWVINKRNGQKLRHRQVGSWTHHFFWDPHSYFEVNAWLCFKNRFKKLIRGKEDVNQRYDTCKFRFNQAQSFQELSSISPILLLTQPSQSIPILSNSIDFIFTDPPYGDSIQYGELASFWARWLGYDMNEYISSIENNEIVINSKQKKTINEYASSLLEVFQELYRVLKPQKFMVLTFHNSSLAVRNALIEQVIRGGFTLKQILFQLPPRVSIKSLLHHSGTPIGDYFIRFQKTAITETYNPIKDIMEDRLFELWDPQFLSKDKKTPDHDAVSAQIKKIIQEILTIRAEPTLQIWILNLLDELLFKSKIFPLPKVELYLKELHESSEFIIDANSYWWFSPKKIPENINIPLTNRIEAYLKKLIPTIDFNRVSRTKKQYLFNSVYSEFRGILTPDKFLINKLINQIYTSLK